MVAFATLAFAALFVSSVAADANAHRRDAVPRAAGSHRESRHKRGAPVMPAAEEALVARSSESISLEGGVGAETLGWWLAGSDCQGSSDFSKCAAAVGKDYASSWKEAKAPVVGSSSSSSSASSTHVSSSSRSTSTHASSSSSHSTSTHVSSTHASPTPKPSSSSSSGSGSCPANSKRSNNAQFGFSSAKFEANALRAHNDLRALAGAPALSWSDDLVAEAAKWASQCVWSRSGTEKGENLAAGYPNVASAVREWGADASSEQSAQMLDEAVTAVGCAVRTCDFASQEPDVFDFGPVKYYVCAYDVAVSPSA